MRDSFSDTPIKGALSNNSFRGCLYMKIKEALQGLQAEKKIGNYSHDGISRPRRGTGMTSLRYEDDRTLSLTRRLTTWTYYNSDGRTRPIQNLKTNTNYGRRMMIRIPADSYNAPNLKCD